MRDENPRVGVAHRVDQMRQRDDRVRRPVAVMPAVQRTQRPVRRDLDVGNAPRAEEELHLPALMHRTVAKHPGIGGEIGRVLLEIRRQMRRSRLFFALEDELHVDGRRALARLQAIDRGEHGDDRSLVVARGARVDAVVFDDRAPRRRGPLRGIDRLAVVVRVERDRLLRLW